MPGFVTKIQDSFRRLRAPLVLCAEDDDDVRKLCVTALTRAGFTVDAVGNGREALENLRRYRYAAVVLDLGLPFIHGSTLLSVIQQENPDILRKLIVVTGIADAALVDVQPRVAAVLRKPVSTNRLVETVRYLQEPDTVVMHRV